MQQRYFCPSIRENYQFLAILSKRKIFFHTMSNECSLRFVFKCFTHFYKICSDFLGKIFINLENNRSILSSFLRTLIEPLLFESASNFYSESDILRTAKLLGFDSLRKFLNFLPKISMKN